MIGKVKLLSDDGNEVITTVAEAANMLRSANYKICEFPVSLQPYFNIQYPYIIGAATENREKIATIHGSYMSLIKLSLLMEAKK